MIDTVYKMTARPWGQVGDAQRASNPRGRATCLAAASARTRAQIAVRLYLGARRTLHRRWLRPYGGKGGYASQVQLQSAPAHAPARLRLRACQLGARCPRHSRLTSDTANFPRLRLSS